MGVALVSPGASLRLSWGCTLRRAGPQLVQLAHTCVHAHTYTRTRARACARVNALQLIKSLTGRRPGPALGHLSRSHGAPSAVVSGRPADLLPPDVDCLSHRRLVAFVHARHPGRGIRESGGDEGGLRVASDENPAGGAACGQQNPVNDGINQRLARMPETHRAHSSWTTPTGGGSGSVPATPFVHAPPPNAPGTHGWLHAPTRPLTELERHRRNDLRRPFRKYVLEVPNCAPSGCRARLGWRTAGRRRCGRIGTWSTGPRSCPHWPVHAFIRKAGGSPTSAFVRKAGGSTARGGGGAGRGLRPGSFGPVPSLKLIACVSSYTLRRAAMPTRYCHPRKCHAAVRRGELRQLVIDHDECVWLVSSQSLRAAGAQMPLAWPPTHFPVPTTGKRRRKGVRIACLTDAAKAKGVR